MNSYEHSERGIRHQLGRLLVAITRVGQGQQAMLHGDWGGFATQLAVLTSGFRNRHNF